MNYFWIEAFSYSILFAAIIGMIKYKKIHHTYYPFLYLTWIGSANEILSSILVHTRHSNWINNNIYSLAEALMIFWQFKRWGLFKPGQKWFRILQISLLIFWTIQIITPNKLAQGHTYFQVYYNFITVLFSINLISEEAIREKKNILKNSIFLICIGFVIYFTINAIVQTFEIFERKEHGIDQFMTNVQLFQVYVNLFVNLIYSLAILWMPTKHRFSLPS